MPFHKCGASMKFVGNAWVCPACNPKLCEPSPEKDKKKKKPDKNKKELEDSLDSEEENNDRKVAPHNDGKIALYKDSIVRLVEKDASYRKYACTHPRKPETVYTLPANPPIKHFIITKRHMKTCYPKCSAQKCSFYLVKEKEAPVLPEAKPEEKPAEIKAAEQPKEPRDYCLFFANNRIFEIRKIPLSGEFMEYACQQGKMLLCKISDRIEDMPGAIETSRKSLEAIITCAKTCKEKDCSFEPTKYLIHYNNGLLTKRI